MKNLNKKALFVIASLAIHSDSLFITTFAAADSSSIPWDVLQSEITSRLETGGFTPWREECILPMKDALRYTTLGGMAFGPSNYEFIADPKGGQCMVFGQSCAYWNCEWPYEPTADGDNSAIEELIDNGKELRPDLLNLPAKIIFPENAGDIQKAIEFATQYNIPVKIKLTGHSHVGDSTGRDALLIDMRSYPRYADPDAGDGGRSAIVECNTDATSSPSTSSDAKIMACNLAQARNVQAYIKVGGGQIFDEVLRTLANFNEEAAADVGGGQQQYHLISGASGTVGVTGGWLAGGGLGLTQAGRHFGFGVDQVLLYEMILPTGEHVQFGPKEWSWEDAQAKDLLQPTTTVVTGYCNAHPEETDESKWVWTDCSSEDGPNFADLWFALRGGGGGSFGVVTAIYYQLQNRPGDMEVVLMSPVSNEWADVLTPLWVDFYIDFFVDGNLPNVTQENSNMCGSYIQQHSFKGPAKQQQLFFCFNGAGQVLASAWEHYVLSNIDTLTDAGLSQDEVNSIASGHTTIFTYPSYAAFSLNLPEALSYMRNPSNPEGRASDLVPGVFVNRGQAGMNMYQVPRSLFETKREEISSFLKGLNGYGSTYMMGGNHLTSHDQMTSMPTASREAAFLLSLENYEEQARLFEIMFGDYGNTQMSSANFPGLFCLNIALVNDIGPQKDDWTKPCNKTWSKAEQRDKCISFQEATFGTDLLKRLEDIKSVVDPHMLFVQEYGIKGNSGVKDEGSGATKIMTSVLRHRHD